MKNSFTSPVGKRADSVVQSRRDSLKAVAASAAVLAAPAFVRAQPAPIKVGMTAPFTGRFAMAGIGNAAAARMVFEKVNASGGIEGRKLELVTRDSRILPEEAVKNVRNLVNADGCTIIMCGESSAGAFAVNEALRGSSVACFHVSSETTELTADPKNQSPLAFRVARMALHDAIATGNVMAGVANKRGVKRIATCSPDYQFGRDLTQLFLDYFKRFGGQASLATQVWPKLGQPDFTEAVTKLLSSNCDAVYSTCFGADAISLVEQGNLYGLFDKRIAFMPLLSDFGVIDVIKKLPKEAMAQNRYNPTYPDTPANRKWYEDFQKVANMKPHNWAWQSGAAAQFIADGLRATRGDADAAKVAKAVRGATAEVPFGLSGKVTLRESDNTLVDYPLGCGFVQPTDPFMKDWIDADWAVIREHEAEWKKARGFA